MCSNPFLPAWLVTEDRLYEAICWEIQQLPQYTERSWMEEPPPEPFEHPLFEQAWDALEPIFEGKDPSFTFPTGRTLKPLLSEPEEQEVEISFVRGRRG